ncbi:MAG: PHP domain-containing protein [Treponema sp.]|jgi:hypothetical protein|nr:PHP domain-containing protein [Treponema sp.]
MAFLYETHLHTKEGSSCGVSRGRDYVQKYLDLGYTGIIITDHFFRGNCRADRNLPWNKWVQESCRGYETAREEGERRGLDVFFGWEETIDGEDFLVYGLGKEWLLEHPEAAGWTRQEQFEEVKCYGGCVVHAHPFRYIRYRKHIPDTADFINAVEVANSGNDRFSDALAWSFAQKLKIPVTAGSDIHCAADIQADIVFGVYLDRKLESIADYVKLILGNAIAGLKVPARRFDFKGY